MTTNAFPSHNYSSSVTSNPIPAGDADHKKKQEQIGEGQDVHDQS